MEKESGKRYKDSINNLVESSFTIHDLPQSERPRERLKRFGSEALSAQELLALIIGRGIPRKSVINIAQELLTKFKSIKGIAQATLEELSQIKGINLAKAAQIKACFELGRRQDLEQGHKEITVESPDSIVKVIRASIKDKAKEHFKLILLNTRNRIIGISTISIGTLDANLVHPREVFKDAISHNAASVILVHNHPSGNREPSEDDLEITKRLVEAGRILGIEVLDHIIITKDRFLSFKEKRLM